MGSCVQTVPLLEWIARSLLLKITWVFLFVSDDVYDDEVELRSTQRAVPPTTTTTTPVADDVLSAYVSRTGGKRAANSGHKWNEHDYYMKAMEDMRRHHEDKINKV